MKRTWPDNLRLTRHGVTMVELLVVLLVIGIVLALLLPQLGRLLTGGRKAATQTTIAVLDDVIQSRYEAVRSADVSADARKLSQMNSGVTEDEAEFLIRKTLYRQALPQREQDLYGLDLDDITNDLSNAPYLADWESDSGISVVDSDRTHSELFLYALTQGDTAQAFVGGRSYPLPTLAIDDINSNHLEDIDSNGLQEVVDDWGNPLRFYNFPTGLIRPGGGTSSIDLEAAEVLMPGLPSRDTTDNGPLAEDPFDPTGLLVNDFSSDYSNFRVKTGGSGTLTVDALNQSNYHTQRTYFTPLLISIGPDNALGLDGEPWSSTGGTADLDRLAAFTSGSIDAMTDNITNLQ